MVIWLTGNSGSGKTTVAKNAMKHIDHLPILLDGDEMRQTISLGAGFSKDEREEHNLRIARLANLLSNHGHLVLVTVIAPFDDARAKVQKICAPVWVYVKRPSLPEDPNRPYQAPAAYAYCVDNDAESEEDAGRNFYDFIKGMMK